MMSAIHGDLYGVVVGCDAEDENILKIRRNSARKLYGAPEKRSLCEKRINFSRRRVSLWQRAAPAAQL